MTDPPDRDRLLQVVRDACRGVDELRVPCRECHVAARETCRAVPKTRESVGGVRIAITDPHRAPHASRRYDAWFESITDAILAELAELTGLTSPPVPTQ